MTSNIYKHIFSQTISCFNVWLFFFILDQKQKNPFIFWPGPLLWQNKYLGYIPLLLGCRHILSHLFLLCLFKECRHDWPYANARGPASHNYIIKGFCIIHTYVCSIVYMYHPPPQARESDSQQKIRLCCSYTL